MSNVFLRTTPRPPGVSECGMNPAKRALGIALGILIIPAVLWVIYGFWRFVDAYLFRL